MAEDTVGTMTPENMSEQTEIRLNKLRALQEAGRNPYAITHFEVTHASDAIVRDYDALENAEVTIAGRLMSRRVMGKAAFAHLLDRAGEIQIYVKRDDVGEDVYKDFKDWDIGDMLGVKGFVFKTKTGEISVHAKELTLLTKSLHPLPEKFHGLTNTDTRYRQRYLDLIVNPEVKDTFVKRSQILRELRAFLDGRGFLEVDTPILTPFEIGASARPFYTHHNALDMDMVLRIETELYLKRLIVGGMDRVYEVGRIFRNEGMDTKHNPEFTTIELYQAYTDFHGMMELVEDMMKTVAQKVCGSLVIPYQGHQIDLGNWQRLTMVEAVKKYSGVDYYDWKSDEDAIALLSFDKMLARIGNDAAIRHTTDQQHGLEHVKDVEILHAAAEAIEHQKEISLEYTIANTDRACGAMLSGAIAAKCGETGLPEHTLNVKFKGSAGQSFGAFLVPGVHFKLEGEANDYLGKGLSGGRIAVLPPVRSNFDAEKNTIAGNTLLYGATSGEVYINGRVGERFAVRNSGATTVVEGVGDHCCEYMTGGRVVVLGQTGRNFAAGMSGGVAYVWNPDGNFDYFCNMEMVELSLIEEASYRKELHELIRQHYLYTGSKLARTLLDDWQRYADQFIQVVPIEYKKVLQEEQMRKLQQKIAEMQRDY